MRPLSFVFFALVPLFSWAAPRCRDRLVQPENFSQWLSQAQAVLATSPQPFSPLPLTRSQLPLLVVGAGPAGLAAMNALKQAGVSFVGIERHSDVGGMWNQGNPESPAYDSLRTNSSKFSTHLGVPHAKGTPDYLSRREAVAYMQDFAESQDLLRHLFLSTSLLGAKKGHDGEWHVRLRLPNGLEATRSFRGIVVATGAYGKSKAAYPEELWNAAIAGGMRLLHSSDYRGPDIFAGQNVLVLGTGNSGADIATEVSQVARSTTLSVRTPPWLVPLYVLGTPADKFAAESPLPLPHSVEMFFFRLLQRFTVGTPASLGFAAPEHDILDKLPISERGLAEALRSGRIQLRSSIHSITGDRVHFEKAGEAPMRPDVLIFATGYRNGMPFLPAGELPTFFVFSQRDPSLSFMNEVQVPESSWPMFTAQARAIAAYYSAEQKNPARAALWNRMRALDIPPDFKGPLFRAADIYHVDPKRYGPFLGELRDWLSE